MERILTEPGQAFDFPAPPIRAEIKRELIRNLIETNGPATPTRPRPGLVLCACVFTERPVFLRASVPGDRNSDHQAKWVYTFRWNFFPGGC